MDMQRRNLFRGKISSHTEDIRLPWLKSLSLFYENCSRCYDCIQACPEHIINIADGKYPGVNFKTGGCTFCGECAEACSLDLFNSHTSHKPWHLIAQVGKSCLSYQQVSCRSCEDSCPSNAIKFTPQLGKTPLPEIILDQCTGCGFCVSPCPVFALEIVVNTNASANINSRAGNAHKTSLAEGTKTCIDCHKGIAHLLPDMKDVEGWN